MQIEEIKKMVVNEIKEVSISEFFEMCEKEEGEYQIETPDGWKNINFLVKKHNKESYNIVTETGKHLECSAFHKILTQRGWVKAEDIDVQYDQVFTKDGNENIVAKEYIGEHDTFDLQVDSENSSYYTNGIISHNCGKSLLCKAVSNAWGMPLLRLDFGRLFGSLVGDSERNARDAIKLAEAVAPCILWMDEIEKAISGVQSSGRSDGGTTSRVLSTFLTWMQEKTSSVFVVATANDHISIPAEFLRAGRFDEIFFVDLPNKDEREEIFEVLLRLRNIKNRNKINIELLAEKSKDYSGAEIEKAIDNAMLAGFLDKKRPICTDDIIKAMNEFKPLSVMRETDFEDLREWADQHCLKANMEEKKKVSYGLDSNKELDL